MGTMQHIDWKYFKLEEAPLQKLITTPLMKEDGTPAYCAEQLKWYENSWDVPEEQKNLFNATSEAYYNMIYKTMSEGAPLEITPAQVRRQIRIIEESHRQNPLK
jgi:scyllo-inositol 2-dehydrogenase (NADP+)